MAWPQSQLTVCSNLEAYYLRTKFVPSVDGKYGVLTEDGTFNGVIGMLERGEVVAGLNAFSLSNARAQVADHLVPLGRTQ